MINHLSKKWEVAERRHEDLLEHLFLVRGIADRDKFLTPRFPDDLPDPFLMSGMARAAERVAAAIRAGEIMGLYADYDADGTPGAAILAEGLRALGGRMAVYIPTRAEGYGLSEAGVRALASAGARLVITIDLGVTGKELVAFGRTLGLDMIVADHHTVQPDAFPDQALAVLNPKQAACAYPEKELCGAGIAWKLLCAVLSHLEREAPAELAGRNPEAIRRWTLDLAGIATIADLVPLRGENRLLAYYGLKVLAKTRRLGLRALYETAGIDASRVSAGTVGFQIAPRLNAPTRLAASRYDRLSGWGPQPSLSFALLVTTDRAEAAALAAQLGRYNQERQQRLNDLLGAAEHQIAQGGLANDRVIVVAGEGWPEGIVGLVAARLLERYGRPVVALALGDELATGSARSIDPFPLVTHLAACRDLLVSFGGHHKAAGVRLRRSSLPAFREALLAQAAAITDADLAGRISLDAALTPSDLTLETARLLEQLAPFGVGNPRPTFLLAAGQIVQTRVIGGNQNHLAITVRWPAEDGAVYRLVGWRMAAEREALSRIPRHDFAVQLETDVWQGQERLDLKIVAHRPAEV